jgi:2-dehydropantoate 2-reductase
MGAGAVGSYYGALLARAGHEVALVARGAHGDALGAAGAVVVREGDGTAWRARVAAPETPSGPAVDLAVVTTKSHDTRAAARALAPVLGPGSVVLSLQNGVTNPGVIAEEVDAPVVWGLAFVGLHVERPGEVVHTGEGRVSLGDPAGGMGEAARRAFAIVAGAWDATPAEDMPRQAWRKLLWNVGFNALCAVTGASAGEALATPESAALVREAMLEVLPVAAARGIPLTAADVDEMAARTPSLDAYHPSMSHDLARGRRTERAAIGGFVVAGAARLGRDAPVNRVLDGLLALREDRRRHGTDPRGE